MRVFKYNLNWQLTRVKNRKVSLEDKLNNVISFLCKYPSEENKERVLNYLKGLELGYKNIEDRARVRSIYNLLKDKKCKDKDIDIPINEIDTKQLLYLYKDLYNRNKRWLDNNYRNDDLNEFLDVLYNELTNRNEKVEKLDIYPVGKSKQKFIY